MEKIAEITKNIIKESIKSVICIDDEFLQPYTKDSEQDSNNIAKELYESFSSANCLLDIVKYNTQEQCKNKFENKDLLILDWELTKSEPKYIDSLEIIEKVSNSDIQFICIYTHSPEIEDIYNAIYCYFLGYCKQDLEETSNVVYSNNLDEIIKCYNDDIKDFVANNNNKDSYKILKEKMIKELSYEERKNSPITNDFIEKVYINITNRLVPDIVRYNFKAKKIVNNGETVAININGKILIIIKKGKNEAETEVIAKPSELLDKFTKNIAIKPNNIFNIIWLQYKNYFNRVLIRPVDFFQDINENVFLYHNEQLVRDAYESEKISVFDSFIKEFYKDELISKLNIKNNIITPLEIIEYMNNKEYDEPNEEEILKLNYYYSVNKNISNKDRKIQFGDIFKCNIDNELTDKYVICVTAHCDCLRPDKIYNIYYFALGSKTFKISTPLKNAEQDAKHYSFIKEDNEYISIEWENGILPLFIENCIISSNEVSVTFKKRDGLLQYQCNLKENYTQRIANSAFSFANRVGITFAKKSEDKKTTNSKTIQLTYDEKAEDGLLKQGALT